jgi:hypothetical protein
MKFNKTTLSRCTPYLLMLFFTLIKFNDLFLPYFWDEAWSYLPAIKEMVKKGPSLIPNSISPELYRGHPLLFYFLSSLWIKLCGSNIWISKLFPLLISLFFMHTVFQFTNKFFNYLTAIITLIFLSIQSVFFAQSTFLLPEILLALFTILSLKSHLDKRHVSTILWLTFALYTKESAVVIWAVITFLRAIEVYKTFGLNNFEKLNKILLFLVPLVLVFIFFFLQKLLVGWYFFPEHLSYFNLKEFSGRLNGYSLYLFLYMGRNLLTIFGFIALILLMIKKDSQLKEKQYSLFTISLFVVSYLLFSSLNFYSPRYLISILPFVIMIWVYCLVRVTKFFYKTKAVAILLFLVITANNLYFTVNVKGENDHTLGYRDMIFVQSEIIKFCEKLEINDNTIYTHFLMYNYLTKYELGYLNSSRITFSHIQNKLNKETEFAIISSNELDNNTYGLIKLNGILLKRFEKNGSWSELYKMKYQ